MSKTKLRQPLTLEEEQEIEQRIYYLLRTRALSYHHRWSNQAGVLVTAYRAEGLILVDWSDEIALHCSGKPDKNGIQVFQECWAKTKANSSIRSHKECGTEADVAATNAIRLDDLSNV